MPLIIRKTGFEQFLDPSGGAYIKALIMGDHGSGKTPFAANWPKPIIADCEKGLMSVASMNVPYATINTSADMQALIDHLRRECQKPVEKRDYQTFVLDTFDTYQRKLMQERMKSEGLERFTGWDNWGWLDGKMVSLIEQVLALPMHVVFNLHTKDVEEGEGDAKTLVQKARLKGDFKDTVFQDFDLIGHLEQSYVAGEGEQAGERVRTRQIRWHSEPKYPALRDRSNKLPRFTDVNFNDQDFWQIFNAITSGLDDLQKGGEVETLATETDGQEPAAEAPAGSEGGVLDKPELPRTGVAKKAVAKKTTAKKAAAKKTAAPEPEPAPEPDEAPAATDVPAPGSGEHWTPPADSDVAADPTSDAPSESGSSDAEAAESATAPPASAEPSEQPAESPTPPPAPAAEKAADGAKPARKCGDQPSTFVDKYDPVPGCGEVLTPENAGKAQIAMVKHRTYLCNGCLSAVQGN